jgi:uncharacterized protein
MNGYLLIFFTQQNRKHRGLPLGEWLIQEAQKLGFSGATLITATKGFGHEGKLHSAHFFDLADQPVEVTMALSATDTERVLQRLQEENIKVFYIKTPIEYGIIGES